VPQEKEDAYKYPYSLFVLQGRDTVTKMFSMGSESQLGCSVNKGKPELIFLRSKLTINWSTSIEYVGVHGIPLERVNK
jgi:hypothetical protein